MKNGKQVSIRPIRPEDEPFLIKLHQSLSERTVYMRYFQPLKLSQRTAHERLTRICFIDYDREIVLVAEHKGEGVPSEIIAIGRLSKLRGGSNEAELAVLVDDRYQGQGLGTELYRRLIAVARDEKLEAGRLHHTGREPRDARHLPKTGFPAGGRPGRRDSTGRVGNVGLQ